MRQAVIDRNGNVVNVIEAPKDWKVEGHTLIPSDTASTGDIYKDKKFTTPAPVAGPPSRSERFKTASDKEKIAILAEEAGLV